MANSFSTESENGVIASAFPNSDEFPPHVGLSLGGWWDHGRPFTSVARLSPDDARALGASLQQCADRVQQAWELHAAELSKSDHTEDWE